MNVLVAVLLDKFMQTVQKEERTLSEENVEVEKALIGLDPQFELTPKAQNEKDYKSQQSKLPMKVQKRTRSSSLPDLTAIMRKEINLAYDGDSAVQKDLYKSADIKKLANGLEQQFKKLEL